MAVDSSPFDGESEDEQRAEILQRQEEDRKRLADDRRAERPQAPGVLHLEDKMEQQEEEVGGSESGQVAAGRVAHARPDPDGERHEVAGEADGVPDRRDVAVDQRRRRRVGGVDFVQRRRTVGRRRFRRRPPGVADVYRRHANRLLLPKPTSARLN